ncbi:hypothetical protein GQ457_18G018370 [Hibiscus cannabinus]
MEAERESQLPGNESVPTSKAYPQAHYRPSYHQIPAMFNQSQNRSNQTRTRHGRRSPPKNLYYLQTICFNNNLTKPFGPHTNQHVHNSATKIEHQPIRRSSHSSLSNPPIV